MLHFSLDQKSFTTLPVKKSCPFLFYNFVFLFRSQTRHLLVGGLCLPSVLGLAAAAAGVALLSSVAGLAALAQVSVLEEGEVLDLGQDALLEDLWFCYMYFSN